MPRILWCKGVNWAQLGTTCRDRDLDIPPCCSRVFFGPLGWHKKVVHQTIHRGLWSCIMVDKRCDLNVKIVFCRAKLKVSSRITLPETNTWKIGFPKRESSFPTTIFQGPCWFLGRVSPTKKGRIANETPSFGWSLFQEEIEEVLRQYGGKLRGPYYQCLGFAKRPPLGYNHHRGG